MSGFMDLMHLAETSHDPSLSLWPHRGRLRHQEPAGPACPWRVPGLRPPERRRFVHRSHRYLGRRAEAFTPWLDARLHRLVAALRPHPGLFMEGAGAPGGPGSGLAVALAWVPWMAAPVCGDLDRHGGRRG